jgi:hypothetical protein
VLRSPGQPLDAETRAFMEPRFGHDFKNVRIHTDARAAESATAVNALAYTVGRDVVLGAGQYAPTTRRGQRLLAHELSHVEQQQSSYSSLGHTLTIVPSHHPDEGEADRVANAVVASAGQRRAQEQQSPARTALDNARPGRSISASNRGLELHRSRSGVLSFIGGFFSSIVHGIFGYSDEQLESYLKGLDKSNDIEGDPDSDDKARAVVKKWTPDRAAFNLTPKLKRLLILEMLDGPTTKGDEDAILDLLETSAAVDLTEIFGAAGVNPEQVYSDLDDEGSRRRLNTVLERRYKGGLKAVLEGQRELQPYVNLQSMGIREIDNFVDQNFAGADRQLARKILNDLRAVKGGAVDFENEEELRSEISKRVKTSQLMQASQADQAFDYPENMKQGDCPDYSPAGPQFNARVNKAARLFWSDVKQHPTLMYYFDLSPLGLQFAYQALKSLFTPQTSICDKTLIHCDYLTTVIHLRAFAESLGIVEFEKRVREGQIAFALTYFGAEFITASDVPSPQGRLVQPVSSKAASLQKVQPASETDMVIGDHVIFWNHLAYDGLTVAKPGPWRLENAVLVDKNEKGEDLFEGHGAPRLGDRTVPGTEEDMLNELLAVYNREVTPAENLTQRVESGDAKAQSELKTKFPQVEREPAGKWMVKELPKNSSRPKKSYELRVLTSTKDRELIGLKDPINPTKMGLVLRPVESRKEALPK